MTKWLNGVMDRFNTCADEELESQEPSEEMREGEKALGTLPADLQRLFKYKGLLIDRFNAMREEHHEQHESPDHTPEMCEKFQATAGPLSDEIDVLKIIFWREIREQMGITADAIGIRKGWNVVELSPEEVALERFSGMLMRFPGM